MRYCLRTAASTIRRTKVDVNLRLLTKRLREKAITESEKNHKEAIFEAYQRARHHTIELNKAKSKLQDALYKTDSEADDNQSEME